MTKKYINKTTLISTIVILLGSYFWHNWMVKQIPSQPPMTVIKYNGKSILTSLGDHSWIPKNGGSSYQTEGEYAVGRKTSKFNAKSGDVVHISIKSMQLNPKNMITTQVRDINKYKEYKTFAGAKEYVLPLPLEKGEYIFNVFANWDEDDHNTSTIFRVEIK